MKKERQTMKKTQSHAMNRPAARIAALMTLVASGVAVAQPTSALVLDEFSTSLGIAVDQTGSPVDFNTFPTFARFVGTSDTDADYAGPRLDLIVEITFPNSNPNSDGTGRSVGLAGAGLKFDNYNADSDGDGSNGPGRDPYVLNFTFVESGTNNAVALDLLSMGFRDIDETRGTGMVGEENILVDGPGTGAVLGTTGAGIDVTNELQASGGSYAALGLGDSPFDFKLDPNSSNNDAIIDFADVDGTFSLVFSNEAGGANLGGGFNIVGGAAIDIENPVVTEVSNIPAPGAAAVLGLGGLVAARRRRA